MEAAVVLTIAKRILVESAHLSDGNPFIGLDQLEQPGSEKSLGELSENVRSAILAVVLNAMPVRMLVVSPRVLLRMSASRMQ